MKIEHQKMQQVLNTLFLKHNFSAEKAKILAKTYTESTLSGVNSHGINRVLPFLEYVNHGVIAIEAEAKKVASFGSIERWDGMQGPGIINATICTDRAIYLAKKHGMGLVALRNTNHWMRGGTYGTQAAKAGCIAIMFTNTQPNMPPWGGKESRIGNNPFIVAIPREKGDVLLDMAISQFAFGKINDYKLKGEKLPFPGGWDDKDELSNDPEKITLKERGLPIGYWKGSALSMVLDMLATLLSAGNSTGNISKKEYETQISQVFLCIDPKIYGDKDLQEKLLDEIIAYTQDVPPMQAGDKTYYPGEKSTAIKKNNLIEGIPVNDSVWEQILKL